MSSTAAAKSETSADATFPESSDSDPKIVAALRAAGCVFAEDEARLLAAEARTPQELAAMVRRRVAGSPLQHVLGWAEFCGLRIAVDAGVFVPRPRTELLVREAAKLLRPSKTPSSQSPHSPLVVDLCCGSGAVGAALAKAVDGIELHAADIDPAAVCCARRNLAAACAKVYEGDLFEPLPDSLRGRISVLIANAPYVPTHAIGLLPPEARLHEPLVALDGGADGLDVLRRVTAGAREWLAPGGHLLVESSDRQVAHVLDAMAASGLAPRVVRCDELEASTVIATRPARDVVRH